MGSKSENIADGGEDIFSAEYLKERAAEAIIFKKTDELVSSNGRIRKTGVIKKKLSLIP